MFYKNFLFIFCLVLLNNCSVTNMSKNKSLTFLDNPFINKGFTLIYSDDLYENNIISKKIDERSLIIFQKNLKKNTKVKITNILNNKSVIANVGNDANYPMFNNSVLSIRIAEELDLDIQEPYIEILEVLENSIFIAKKAKTFDEEKNVATKAPVNDISISNLNQKRLAKKKEINRQFNYEVKIADFYFDNMAKLLVKRIKNETPIKNAKIRKVSKEKYRVYLGPFNNINALQKSFNDINILEFENIEIIKRD
ncbi:MAG: hypothetical protein CBD98_002750 [Flavobacteriaceae bacterium TMED238]|jgi:hypothetical protein|nr:MAG: hypothetical protein CBD98_002750 [Flavobacteriaceae bacterium TMED238]|tara:strand:- start:794 stop:1552 length:759 start_codon:yes stop_codon:yes gene_type:complete